MVQGATYLIPVNIDVNLNYVDSIIFTLKCGETKVQKEYPSQTNILKNGNIGIPLNQYETTVLKGLVKIEAQINYKEGRVAKTETDVLQISPTLATKFIDGSESTEPDLDPVLLNTSDPVVAVSGATFIPSVSEDGVISWTNDGDLTNPKPVNIKGKDGKDGTPGANGATFVPSISSDGTLSWTNDGNLKNPESVDIKGKNGENGITYTPSVSNSGIISWENNGNLPNPESVNIKGEKGTPGDTPYIGENGNWFIGDTDTGTPAGGCGGTDGTPNAVQYVPQTLTQAQQTQARKNIDAQSQVYAVKRANPWSAEDCVNAPVRGLKLYGACAQVSSPSPDNPQEIKCNHLTYTLKNDAEYHGGSVTAPSLYGIGDVRDEWDAMTGSGNRRIEKVVIDGTTKTFSKANNDEGSYAYYYIYNTNGDAIVTKDALCTHLIKDISANNVGKFYCTGKTIFINAAGIVAEDNATTSNSDALNTILAEKYTAGNPMTFYIVSDDESFTATPISTTLKMPDGYAQFLPSGDGVAGDIEAEYAVDVEKRYVLKETYKSLEERVAALESAAIGV